MRWYSFTRNLANPCTLSSYGQIYTPTANPAVLDRDRNVDRHLPDGAPDAGGHRRCAGRRRPDHHARSKSSAATLLWTRRPNSRTVCEVGWRSTARQPGAVIPHARTHHEEPGSRAAHHA